MKRTFIATFLIAVITAEPVSAQEGRYIYLQCDTVSTRGLVFQEIYKLAPGEWYQWEDSSRWSGNNCVGNVRCVMNDTVIERDDGYNFYRINRRTTQFQATSPERSGTCRSTTPPQPPAQQF